MEYITVKSYTKLPQFFGGHYTSKIAILLYFLWTSVLPSEYLYHWDILTGYNGIINSFDLPKNFHQVFIFVFKNHITVFHDWHYFGSTLPFSTCGAWTRVIKKIQSIYLRQWFSTFSVHGPPKKLKISWTPSEFWNKTNSKYDTNTYIVTKMY